MGTNLKIMALLAAGLLIGQQAAFSEMVQGQVVSVNQENNSLRLQMTEPTGETKEVELNIPQEGQFRGIQSLAEIEVGDQVRAEAKKPALGMGSWEAQWIEKSAGAGAGAGADAGAGAGAAGGEAALGTEAGAGAGGGPTGAELNASAGAGAEATGGAEAGGGAAGGAGAGY